MNKKINFFYTRYIKLKDYIAFEFNETILSLSKLLQGKAIFVTEYKHERI